MRYKVAAENTACIRRYFNDYLRKNIVSINYQIQIVNGKNWVLANVLLS